MSYNMSYESLSACTRVYDKSYVAKSHIIIECRGNLEELCADLEILKLHIQNDGIIQKLDEIIVELHKLIAKPVATVVKTEIVIKPESCVIYDLMTKALLNRCVAVARRAERYLAKLKVHHYDITDSTLAFMNFLSKYLQDLI